MNARERMRAAIDGKPVDRAPVALWRHFPGEDQKAESLAAAHVNFHQRYQWDFLKVTPASGYYGDDWGLRATYKPNREGTRHYSDRPIKNASDWARLKALDVTAGAYGRELHTLRLVRDALRDTVILSTIFSPLSVARTLSGEQALIRHLRENPDALHRGLEIITDVTAQFAAETLAGGADGLFFATQCASVGYITVEEYEEFGRPYDLRVLAGARGSEVTVLHLHGQDIMFDELTDYPVDVINWHDRKTAPTLAEARARFSGALAGGIDEWTTLSSGSPEQIAAEIADAIAQTGGSRFIAAAGCVTPIDVGPERLQAVRDAVER
ncbi:MAG TPA: uroporphyrinogen decarboxylase family protein [bacterium]|jgi:uroporphyrinogen decarboxylase